MRRNLPIIFAILTLCILILCSACVSQPQPQPPANQTSQNNTPVINIGIVPIASNIMHTSFTLEDAASAVKAEYPYPANVSWQNLSFYYIRGEKVDWSGKAERWIFGTRDGNSSSMVVYDTTGIARISWQGWLPKQEINMTSIMKPPGIVKIAYPDTQNNIGNLELEITSGEYSLTGSSGLHPKEYRINATTGVLISTHD